MENNQTDLSLCALSSFSTEKGRLIELLKSFWWIDRIDDPMISNELTAEIIITINHNHHK